MSEHTEAQPAALSPAARQPVVRLSPSGHEVPVPSGATVLTALEAAGYALPNNCRAGACGECKVKVLCGTFDQGMVLDMALSRAERDEGYGLMCMAKPLGDVLEIEWGTADARPKLFPPREGMPYVVVDRIERTIRIAELRLRPIGDPLRYWPGQYVMVGNRAAGVPERPYSIANAPRPDGELTLLVTRVPGGATSTWLHDNAWPGSQLTISGAYGTFIGDPSVDTPVLCLAAGSGLAPILALTDAALRRGFAHPVTLVFSARSQDEVYCEGLLRYWEAKHRNFRFIRTLTQTRGGTPPIGRIPEMLAEVLPELSRHSVFVAGGPPFVDACVDAARTLGAHPELIHTEGYFDQYVPEPVAADRLVDQLVG